jgi:hypothetical protein
VLHVSDLHLTPGQRRKQDWVAELAALDPDLVVITGDNMAHPDAVPGVVRAFTPLFGVPGAFVFGSNDYRGPVFKNPLSYFDHDREYVQESSYRSRICGLSSRMPVGRPQQRAHAAQGGRPDRGADRSWTTRTSSATTTSRSPGWSTRVPTCTSA